MNGKLHSIWCDGPQNGVLRLTLEAPEVPPPGSRLCLTSQLYPLRDATVTGAFLSVCDGSYAEFIDMTSNGQIEISGLAFTPRHAGEGPVSAWLEAPDGQITRLQVTPMRRDPVLEEVKTVSADPSDFHGPFCLPWPNRVDLTGLVERPTVNFAAAGPELDALHRILVLLGIDAGPLREGQGIPILPQFDRALRTDSYRLRIGADQIDIAYGEGGLMRGLVTLAQTLWGTTQGFGFPAPGSMIEDAPRFDWRGFHLDTARHFFDVSELERALALMAWLKLNRFHWHLTDDEAWRIEVRSFPGLTGTASSRGRGHALTPQLGDAPEGHGGYYSTNEVSKIVEIAREFGIEVVPEIDLPGHSTALLRAYPELVDANEPPDSYRSVQNFANNSLNPAQPGATETVCAILKDILPGFPSRWFHLGGDELPEGAWAQSPVAVSTCGSAVDAIALQKRLFTDLQDWLEQFGKTPCFWDEQGRIGSADANTALIFCWQDVKVAADLAAKGYRLVLCPAQATYLDIAASHDWSAPGSGWAGCTPFEVSYEFEPISAVPPEFEQQIEGIQACLWTESVRNRADFDKLVIPRLFAVAETAWTNSAHKDLERVTSLSASLTSVLTEQHD